MLWNKAVEQVHAGQRQAALSTLQELLKADPHQEPARHLAAVLLHEGGHTDQAMSILSDGLALGGRQVSLALLLARLQAALGLGDAALASLQQSRVEGPEADGLRAGILAQRGNYQDAVPAYQSALRRQPANALWWAGLGVALESDGQAEQAKVAYLQARNLGIAREELASYVDQRIRALD